MGDPEEFYDREIKKIDKEFLEGLKANKINREGLEKIYLKKLIDLREKYSKLILTNLFLSKKSTTAATPTLKNKLKNKYKNAPFKVVKANIELSFKERMKIKFNLFSFKIKIRIRALKIKYLPPKFIIFKIKIRRYIQKVYSWLSNLLRSLYWKIREKIPKFSRS